MTRGTRNVILFVLKCSVAAVLIYIGIRRKWFEASHFRLLAENWHLSLPAALLLAVIPAGTGIRWNLLVRAQGIPLSWLAAVRLSYIGLFLSLFLPGAVTGDFFKAYYIARDQGRAKKTEAVTTVFLDRTVGLFGLTLLASVVVLLNIQALRENPDLRKVAIFIGIILAVAVLGLATLFHPRIRAIRKRKLAGRGRFWQIFDRVDDAIHLYKGQRAVLALTIALSISFHVLQCGVLWLFTKALGGDIAFRHMLLLAPVGFIVNAIPIAPGGAGVGEAGFQSLLAIQNVTVGGAAFLAWRIANFISVSPGAVIWALHRSEVKQAIEDEEKDETSPDEPPDDAWN